MDVRDLVFDPFRGAVPFWRRLPHFSSRLSQNGTGALQGFSTEDTPREPRSRSYNFCSFDPGKRATDQA